MVENGEQTRIYKVRAERVQVRLVQTRTKAKPVTLLNLKNRKVLHPRVWINFANVEFPGLRAGQVAPDKRAQPMKMYVNCHFHISLVSMQDASGIQGMLINVAEKAALYVDTAKGNGIVATITQNRAITDCRRF